MIKNKTISDYYNDKSVFVTGGTGFVGKLIIEKLLRSCSGIKNIYFLCRPLKGKNTQDRLNEVVSSRNFDFLREKNSQVFQKIILIEGDIAKLELGLSKADQDILKENVSVIINSAATTNFNEDLKTAVNTNLRSLNELLNLSRQMRKLESIVHISTAFANHSEFDVKEEIRPMSISPEKVIETINALSDKAAKKLTAKFLGQHPNTYTYTKSLAENLILEKAKDLPIVIIKPSMIGACMQGPTVGYIGNLGALSIFMYTIGKGLFRYSYIPKPLGLAEIIPVDMVTNITIAAACNLAAESNNPEYPHIFNISSGATNPISWKKTIDLMVVNARRHPFESTVWYPQHRIYKFRVLFFMDFILMHLIPAILMDAASILIGKKARAAKVQIRMFKSFYAVGFATSVAYKFRTSNYKSILDKMSESDKREFNFDPKTINWDKYMEDYFLGLKKYIAKEDGSKSDEAMRRLKRLKYVDFFVTTLVIAAGLYMIWSLF